MEKAGGKGWWKGWLSRIRHFKDRISTIFIHRTLRRIRVSCVGITIVTSILRPSLPLNTIWSTKKRPQTPSAPTMPLHCMSGGGPRSACSRADQLREGSISAISYLTRAVRQSTLVVTETAVPVAPATDILTVPKK